MELTSDFIINIMHQVHPDQSITPSAIVYLQQLLAPYFEASQTITSVPSIFEWVKQSLTGELAKHAYSEVAKAVIKKDRNVQDFGGEDPEFIAIALNAFFEYIIAECLELSGNLVHYSDNQITPWDLQRAIINDTELAITFDLSKEDHTLPVTITIGNKNYLHNLSLEFLTGICALAEVTHQSWTFMVFDHPFTLSPADDDERPLHAINSNREQPTYSTHISQINYTFYTPEFIQGIQTAALWLNVDPHSHVDDIILHDNGVDTVLTF